MVACLNKMHGMDKDPTFALQALGINALHQAHLIQTLRDLTATSEEIYLSKQLIFSSPQLDASDITSE